MTSARTAQSQAIEDEGETYDSIQEIWPDYPSDEDYLWNEDEY